MVYYGAIDLHSNNCYLGIIDENEQRIYKRKLPNDLNYILSEIEPYQNKIKSIVVESTYNWYWLVDGLRDNNYNILLANPAAIKQYEGLKYTNDFDDAFFLARLSKLQTLPTGYIYPKKERAVRDLLRKRLQFVQQRTVHLLSFQTLLSRNTGSQMTNNNVKKLKPCDIDSIFTDQNHVIAAKTNIAAMHFLNNQIKTLERSVKKQIKLNPNFEILCTTPGIGNILSLTIMLEAGNMNRFAKVGNYASYCRCVNSKRISNGKIKGKGNTKNGNKHLNWAYVEAANFAIRFSPEIKSYYQRKAAKKNRIVAIKTIAHKLARAHYYMLKNQEPFDVKKAFP